MLLDTPLCDFGWKAPEFSLADPDGVTHRMTDHLRPGGLLVAFICNHCPYVQAIADRLADDAETLQSNDIGVLAIMSNDPQFVPEDAPRFMARFARQHRFAFPYLFDEGQKVGKAYGAVCTPDFFGLNASGELQYRGRLDNAGMYDDAAARTPELVNAMLDIAKTGTGPTLQHPSMGCSIKWRPD